MSAPKVREMELSDLPAAMALDALCLSVPWSEAVWRAELASLMGLHLIVEEAGEAIAQIGSKTILDELHITTLAVHPDHRRRGIARHLVETTMERAIKARRVYLEVRVRNVAAISFYEQLGFGKVGVRPRYYGDEDAFVMAMRIPGRAP